MPCFCLNDFLNVWTWDDFSLNDLLIFYFYWPVFIDLLIFIFIFYFFNANILFFIFLMLPTILRFFQLLQLIGSLNQWRHSLWHSLLSSILSIFCRQSIFLSYVNLFFFSQLSIFLSSSICFYCYCRCILSHLLNRSTKTILF